MSNQVDLKHGGAYEITLSKSGERAVIVEVFDMDGGNMSGVAPMTPAEWDAFVAAGDRALGRKPVRDFPPGPLPRARPSTDAEIVAWMADLYREDTPIAEALGRAALAMAREAGPTVPRAAVAAVVPLLAGVSTMLADSDDAEAKREAVRRLDRIIVALGRMVTDGPTPTEDR